MSRVYIEGRNRKADYKKVVGWVNKWRKRLHLTDWTIYIRLNEKQHKDPTYAADMMPNEQYHHGTMTIYPNLWDQNLKEQERTILHELIHLPMHDVDTLVSRSLFSKKVSKEKILDSFESLTEWMTNTVWDAYEK